jgi:hypothetical protein
MKIGDTVISRINNKVYSGLYSNIVRRDLNNYKNTILYNNVLTVLLIQPNYNQYDIRGKY